MQKTAFLIPFKYQPNKFCRAKGHLVKIKCAKNGLKKLKEKKKGTFNGGRDGSRTLASGLRSGPRAYPCATKDSL